MELTLLILKMASGYLLTTFLYETCTANRSRTMFTWWCACPNVVAFIRTVTEFIPPYTCMHLHFRFPCTYENTCHFIRTLHTLSCFGSCCYRLVLSCKGHVSNTLHSPIFSRISSSWISERAIYSKIFRNRLLFLSFLHSSSRWWNLGSFVCAHLQQGFRNSVRWWLAVIPWIWLEPLGCDCHHDLVRFFGFYPVFRDESYWGSPCWQRHWTER